MQIIPLTNKAKDILGKKKWTLHRFEEKVICFDDQPGYLFVSTEGNWYGVWVRKNNDKDFQLIQEEEICIKT
jgi:hypothetical protein